MKARKPDGTRWFTPTTSELMDRWLSEPQLLDWLRRTVVLLSEQQLVIKPLSEQQLGELASALWREFSVGLSQAVARIQSRKRRGLH